METEHASHSEYASEPRLRDLPIRLNTIARWPFLALIRAYQATLSKAMAPNSCRFYPSCSHYGYQAIYKHGIIKGGWLTVWRILRCNPWNPGGYDPIPE
jgi:putative membrane protein insertion efficiency factor